MLNSVERLTLKMIKLPFTKSAGFQSIAGINIGTNSIKIVAVSNTGKGFSLDNVVVEQIPGESTEGGKPKDSLGEALKRAVDKAKLVSNTVITGISGPAVVVRYINLPQMSKNDLESAVKFEAKPHIPFDLNDVILDFQVLDQGKSGEGKRMKVLLVAAQRNFIHKHIELLEKQGLMPVIIDIDSFALVNAFLHANSEEAKQQEAAALVNLGASLSNVSILNKGVPLFTRDIPMGGNNLSEIISKRLNVDFAQAEKLKAEIEGESSEPFGIIAPVLESLANEIRRSFDYYESQTTAAEKVSFKVYLSGGTAKLKGIENFLGRILDLPVSLWDPFKNFQVNKNRFPKDKLEENLPHLCVGVGLAVRAQESI